MSEVLALRYGIDSNIKKAKNCLIVDFEGKRK